MTNKLLNYIALLISVLFGKFLEDIFVAIGFGIIVYVTYQYNPMIASYLVGGIFVLIGLLLAKKR